MVDAFLMEKPLQVRTQGGAKLRQQRSIGRTELPRDCSMCCLLLQKICILLFHCLIAQLPCVFPLVLQTDEIRKTVLKLLRNQINELVVRIEFLTLVH
jgi:hypothetical protein